MINERGLFLSFFSYFKVFYRLVRGQFLLLPILMLLAGLFESIGIVLFLPLLEHVGADGSVSQGNRFLAAFSWLLSALNLNSVGGILIFIGIVFIFKFLFIFLQEMGIQKISRDLYRTVARRLIWGYAGAEYAKLYLNTTAGYFSNILIRELLTFWSAFSHYCAILVGFLYITAYLTFSLLLDAKTTIFAMVAGIGMFFLFRTFMTRTERYSIEITQRNQQFNSSIIEFMQFYKYLKATHLFPRMIKRLEEVIARVTTLRFKVGMIGSFMGAAAEPIAVVLVALFLYVQVAVRGEPFAPLLVLILLFYRTLMRLVVLQSSWQGFFACSGALRVIPQALARVKQDAEPQPEKEKHTLEKAIEFREVSFSYGSKEVLQNLNMVFRVHTTVALVGTSGAGKSTIVDLLTGILKPTSGTVLIDGASYHELNVGSIRQLMGYVTQEIVIFNDSVAHNVSLWDPREDQERVRFACRRAYCTDFIEALPGGYDTIVGDRGINLSVGQRQRIAIARELYRDPEILIFDEATSALDTESEQFIQKSIEAVKGTKTMVLIAHRLSTIRNADYVYVLDQGRIVEEGTFHDLYSNTSSRFYRMCEQQSFT